MYFILAVAVIGIAIIVERLLLLVFKCNVDGKALWTKISKLIQGGEIEKARAVCKGSDAPLLKVMEAGIFALSHSHKKDVQNIMDEAAMEVLPTIDKRILYLLTLEIGRA